MRPTLLNFRSPKQITPEFYNTWVDREGAYVDYRS